MSTLKLDLIQQIAPPRSPYTRANRAQGRERRAWPAVTFHLPDGREIVLHIESAAPGIVRTRIECPEDIRIDSEARTQTPETVTGRS
jgi:hypothetical protein